VIHLVRVNVAEIERRYFMGRKCLTCTHPKYRAINRSLVENRQPIAAISREYGISTDALRNHQRRCLHTNLRRAQERRENDYLNQLLGMLKENNIRFKRNLVILDEAIEKASKKGHYHILEKLMRENRRINESILKIVMSIQREETDIETTLQHALQDERLGGILQDLPTPALRALHMAFSLIMDRTSTPLLEVGSGPVIDVNGGGASEVEGDDLETDNLDVPLMVRTRFPRGDVEDLDSDRHDEVQTTDQANAQDDGGEDQDELAPIETTPPEREWRPPISQIHFESGQAFAAHLYRKKRKRK